jgi:hypothetical protein
MHFGSIDPDAGTFELNQRYAASRRAGAAEELRREFRLGDVEFTCWQYVHPHRYQRVGPSSTEPLWWNIDCSTPVDVRQQNMYAWFLGRQEDISSFYTIIEGVKPREWRVPVQSDTNGLREFLSVEKTAFVAERRR